MTMQRPPDVIEIIGHFKRGRSTAAFPVGFAASDVHLAFEMKWWEWLLHTRKPARLRRALIKRGDNRVVVISVPWYLQ
jgi:hypothetical protein